MKKLTTEKLKLTTEIITEEEKLCINTFSKEREIADEDKKLISNIYQLAKNYSDEKYKQDDLFLIAFDILEKELISKNDFKNRDKWEEQLLWRVRMKILEFKEDN